VQKNWGFLRKIHWGGGKEARRRGRSPRGPGKRTVKRKDLRKKEKGKNTEVKLFDPGPPLVVKVLVKEL